MSPQQRLSVRASDDLLHGQIVLVIARWILVAAGLVLVLWNPGAIGTLRIQIAVLLLLAFGNFYLHMQLLRRQPWTTNIAFFTSAADLFVITIIVILQGGFWSGVYVFYFPAILGLAVAFPRVLTLLLAGGTIISYLLISLVGFALYGSWADTTDAYEVLVGRLLMFSAVAFCGQLYQRIEADRRRESEEAEQTLIEEIKDQAGGLPTGTVPTGAA